MRHPGQSSKIKWDETQLQTGCQESPFTDFEIKTSSFASSEADFHCFSNIHNPFLNFLLYQTIFCARSFGRAHKPLHLQQNLAFVAASPHSSSLFTPDKYFIKSCSFNWTSQTPLPATHSLWFLLLHTWKNYQQITEAVLSFWVLPQHR